MVLLLLPYHTRINRLGKLFIPPQLTLIYDLLRNHFAINTQQSTATEKKIYGETHQLVVKYRSDLYSFE